MWSIQASREARPSQMMRFPRRFSTPTACLVSIKTPLDGVIARGTPTRFQMILTLTEDPGADCTYKMMLMPPPAASASGRVPLAVDRTDASSKDPYPRAMTFRSPELRLEHTGEWKIGLSKDGRSWAVIMIYVVE